MASLTLGSEETCEFLCVEYVGNYLYVAAENQSFRSGDIYRYHVVNNTWETLPRFQSSSMSYGHMINCLCYVNEHIYAISDTDPPQRYSLAQKQWQSGSKLPFLQKSNNQNKRLINVAAVVMKSKIYVLHGCCIVDTQGLTTEHVQLCFIVLIPKRMNGNKRHQPPPLTLDPVSLWIATNFMSLVGRFLVVTIV